MTEITRQQDSNGTDPPGRDSQMAALAELIAERDQLLSEKDANNEVLAACRAQINAANARANIDRCYTDPKWFAAVKTRARYAGHEDQKIGRRLSELRRQILKIKQECRIVTAEDSADETMTLLISAMGLIQRALDRLRE